MSSSGGQWCMRTPVLGSNTDKQTSNPVKIINSEGSFHSDSLFELRTIFLRSQDFFTLFEN